MLVPIGESVSVPAQVVCPTSSPPIHVEGTLVEYDGEACVVTLPAAADVPTGAQVILSLESKGLRMITEAIESEGDRLRLRVCRVSRKDKRDYPRQDAGVELRYQVVRTERTRRSTPAFLNGLSDMSDPEPWHEPHPFMNFSGSGVRFEHTPTCDAGDELRLQIRLPIEDSWHHATGRVVRVEPCETPLEERTHHIAVQFEALPGDAVDALTRYTLDCQLLEMETDPK